MTELGQVFAIALVIAAIGPVILLLGLGSPFRGAALVVGYLRVAFLVFLPSVTSGLGSLLIAQSAGLDPLVAPVAAAMGGMGVLASKFWQFVPLSRLRRALMDLSVPERQGTAVSSLVAALHRLRPHAPIDRPLRGPYPELALVASAQLIATGFFRQAEEVCASIPEAWLSEVQSTHRANNLAVCRMRLGNLPGAREALDHAKRPTTRPERNILETSRGMLLMLEDKPQEALAIVGDDRFIDGITRLTALVVRAHAHAGLGDRAAARSALIALVQSYGEEALDAVIESPGPARILAAELKAERSRQR
ncbi:MAG: hypothetical protein U1E65_31545 [Myxococcota bacterium]